MSVGEFCNRGVVVIDAGESVRTAAGLMREHHVGDVVVIEEREGRRYPTGIVTDRDLVVELLAPGIEADPAALRVQDLLTEPLLTAYEDDPLLDTLKRMRNHGVRRMPVIAADGSLAGILSLDDVFVLIAEAMADVASLTGRERAREARKRH